MALGSGLAWEVGGVREGRDICIPVADSCYSMAETVQLLGKEISCNIKFFLNTLGKDTYFSLLSYY